MENGKARDEAAGEIGALALAYLEEPQRGGILDIDSHIHAATDESRWDEVGKWHRVRLRFLRFKRERMVRAELLRAHH